jgi:hypothetical protein
MNSTRRPLPEVAKVVNSLQMGLLCFWMDREPPSAPTDPMVFIAVLARMKTTMNPI